MVRTDWLGFWRQSLFTCSMKVAKDRYFSRNPSFIFRYSATVDNDIGDDDVDSRAAIFAAPPL